MEAIATGRKLNWSPVIDTKPEVAVMKVLAYFDIFHYPLTAAEVRKFLDQSIPGAGLDILLDQLIKAKKIFCYCGFYTLHDNPLLIYRRRDGNQRAVKLLRKAFEIGRFLYKFPYIKAVGISGSLSKNFADADADIDFFVITSGNRLWIGRTFMHLFKKLTFLAGKQHYFCMNYYVDEEVLDIKPQNIFTAMEIVTLVPVAGKETIEKFIGINEWAYRLFPSMGTGSPLTLQDSKPWYKKGTEWLFGFPFGDRLDNWLQKVTTRRWENKNRKGKRNKNGHAMQLETGKHFCRSNPGAFQEKVLALFDQKLDDLNLR